MSLRNGMWHGLRNDIVMRNVIYEMAQRNKLNRKSYARLCRVSFWQVIFFFFLPKFEEATALLALELKFELSG